MFIFTTQSCEFSIFLKGLFSCKKKKTSTDFLHNKTKKYLQHEINVRANVNNSYFSKQTQKGGTLKWDKFRTSVFQNGKISLLCAREPLLNMK